MWYNERNVKTAAMFAGTCIRKYAGQIVLEVKK